ncbi:hypothetical protein D9613_000767 [Agrocybe pediades]|uniref:Uncharacterized protein n=1 Tax=Agrocybe pediades TaxID=84607 RepID=A0A8H4QZT4_9AGAR|nr:hypothetical protein D9613_000767 [Agrocybe pediades]
MPDSFTYLPSQLHLFPPNPYPSHTPIAHKVWILDCKNCDSFLTNRAMKAVLLLRPNVSLYSSDALPVNCSAYSSSPEALKPPSSHKPSSTSRTCECLTQSLCCHTCGNTIGYMIVVPCARCTSSISATNRATNGHRFVFHSSEVIGTERHYIQGEPGVIPFDPPASLSPPPLMPNPQNMAYPSPPYSPTHYYSMPFSQPRPGSPPIDRSDYLPTPPLEYANPVYPSHRHSDSSSDASSPVRVRYSPRSRSPPPVMHVHASHYPLSPHSPSQGYFPPDGPPPLTRATFHPADQKEPLLPAATLKPGNVIFWHHLARNGEIPGVADDKRARDPAAARASTQIFYDR